MEEESGFYPPLPLLYDVKGGHDLNRAESGRRLRSLFYLFLQNNIKKFFEGHETSGEAKEGWNESHLEADRRRRDRT